MSSSLISFFCLFGLLSALPIETTTELPVTETTITWLDNASIRNQIVLVSEFVRIREEQYDALASSTESPDNSMIPMADIDGSIEDVKNLINKFFAIKKDLENKKKEYEIMTTTTAAPIPPQRGFIRKLLDKISFF